MAPSPAQRTDQIGQDVLDALAVPGAGVSLVPLCHERSALRVWYAGGLLTLACAVCDSFVASIRVAP
jgi:hypothetical protein